MTAHTYTRNGERWRRFAERIMYPSAMWMFRRPSRFRHFVYRAFNFFFCLPWHIRRRLKGRKRLIAIDIEAERGFMWVVHPDRTRERRKL